MEDHYTDNPEFKKAMKDTLTAISKLYRKGGVKAPPRRKSVDVDVSKWLINPYHSRTSQEIRDAKDCMSSLYED